MNLLALILITGSSLTFAAPQPDMKKAVGILDEMNNPVSYNYCDPKSAFAPEWCSDLAEYSCSQKKFMNKKDQVDTRITNSVWATAPKELALEEYNKLARKAFEMSEGEVFKTAQIKRDEIRLLLESAKSEIKNFVTSTPLFKGVYTREKVLEMSNKVDSVKLRYGWEYVEDLISHAKSQGVFPEGTTDAQIRSKANSLYMSQCGVNGLSSNAFYEGGALVLCPGLILSLYDFSIKKEDLMNALAFTMGHELGHAIDNESYPEAYAKMGGCYQKVSRDPNIWSHDKSAEITADYWGSLVLSARIKAKTPEDSAKTVAYAMDGFCQGNNDRSSHPDSTFRINQILGKHPLIAEQLSCAPPTKEKPYCSMRGPIPQ